MPNWLKEYFEGRRRSIQDLSSQCEKIKSDVESAMKEYGVLFTQPEQYLDSIYIQNWQDRWKAFSNHLASVNWRHLRKAPICRLARSQAEQFKSVYIGIKSAQEINNSRYVRQRLEAIRRNICPVEGRQLDDQQLACILKDANSQLVVAGAGTGKTTTIIGKIKWLLKTGMCTPADILVLSFTHVSASEMSERIAKETGQEIAAMTFHKLGMDIITAVEGVKPRITAIKLRKLIPESIQRLLDDPVYLSNLMSFFLYNPSKARSEFDFRSQTEYESYLLVNPPTTLKGETVKSYSEMNIANFLLRNRIRYEYEAAYPIDTATTEYGQYRPDFYLPEYQIYIEHYAVDRNGNVPDYFHAKPGFTPTETYQQSIDWKRGLHSENGSRLVEVSFSHTQEGQLLEKLQTELKRLEVELNPMTDKELWDTVVASEGNPVDGLTELMETVINLTKSNGTTIDEIRRANAQTPESCRAHNELLLWLTKPIFEDYCRLLAASGEIDFNDMINMAASNIREGSWNHSYRYVFVDEYQDIARNRYELLKQMRQNRHYKLFCVGDDWQSIYRFTGSDIGFLFDFDRYWGPAELSRIETTYRFSQKLIEISSRFIMKNPRQIVKRLQSKEDSDIWPLGVIEGYSNKYAVDFMALKMKDLEKGSSVLLIGRYCHDIKMLDGSAFTYRYDNTREKEVVSLSFRRDLNIEFKTAHKSKGLQADYVFILNNRGSRMGFPSRIQDDSVLDLLLVGNDTFQFAEERRLFYVALTRAKKKVWLLVQKDKGSTFLKELTDIYGDQIKRERFTCPLCGGALLKRKGQYGEFFGCSNYSKMGCRFIRDIS